MILQQIPNQLNPKPDLARPDSRWTQAPCPTSAPLPSHSSPLLYVYIFNTSTTPPNPDFDSCHHRSTYSSLLILLPFYRMQRFGPYGVQVSSGVLLLVELADDGDVVAADHI